MKKAYINWSSGKDAAFALYNVQKEGEYEVQKLVSTVNIETNRVSMHGLRVELMQQQAAAIGIPLQLIEMGGNVSMQSYNELMEVETEKLLDDGFNYSIFGDIFLEDLREYREKQLGEKGIKAVFPLWKKDTTQMMQDFLEAGFKAIVVSVNAAKLDKSFCGRLLDESFLKDLPSEVDPCGEHGEFHTFVYDGPNFSQEIAFEVGEVVEKNYSSSGDEDDDCFRNDKESWDTRFFYCDLLPKK
ncbi:Dph6-related ATP pyrophosphatase [Salegentibacter sediminis]|uniref:Dph6-related ATP pyrophosphatase n=1 Tax=Salegentibacter sediminis TaxID=1930251 RepID=UPI0009BF7265|nr:diphthine--ammonia ligase [Salegentibacter sediminis]